MPKLKERLSARLGRRMGEIWKKMEIGRLGRAVMAAVRAVIRLCTYPILWLDGAVEAIRRLAKPETERLKEPTRRQIYAKMTSSVIDGILENKNTAAGSRNVRQVKWWCIILLEFASFVTTAIGMTIIASDISPAIAVAWALVIQGLVAVLSGTRGKWNNVILAICMAFSMASDYVCYINAVFPYDVYIEQQYTQFKNAYDPVWEYALAGVEGSASVETGVADAFGWAESQVAWLTGQYSEAEREKLANELQQIDDQLKQTPSTIKERTGTDVTVDPVTGEKIYTGRYEVVENPEYTALQLRRTEVAEKLAGFDTAARDVMAIQALYDGLNADHGADAEQRAKQLLLEMQDTGLSQAVWAAKEQELAQINRKLQQVREALAAFSGNQEGTQGMDLTQLQAQNEAYRRLAKLRLPTFSEIQDTVDTQDTSAFDQLFTGAATLLDSEFAINAMEVKELAETETNKHYSLLMEAVADSLATDEGLQDLVYGDPDNSGGALPLVTAYENAVYTDAMSKALEYLFSPGGKLFAVITRVIYAFLADGIVLLIGFSLRRKNTAVYRIHNRRDLTNEEPRLISETFYNLASKACVGEKTEENLIAALISSLEDFRDLFEAESFFRDPNLNSSYSMVCKDPDAQYRLQTEYKELLSLLQTLKYVKTISSEQYTFVCRYKLNKATMEKDVLKAQIKNLRALDGAYYYLMTEGFALYLSEKINDLYQNVEARLCSGQIKEALRQ